MTRDERSILLAILIPVIFGVIILLEKGSFILPFPLNEVIFAVVVFVFIFRHRKTHFLQSVFSFGFAILNLLSTEFVWSLMMDSSSMNELYISGTMDLIRLMAAVLLLFWSGVGLIRIQDKIRILLFIVFFGLYAASLLVENPLLYLLSLLVPFAAGLRYHDLRPFNLLWLLLMVLNGMTFIMLEFSK